MVRAGFRLRWRSVSTKRSAVARKRGCGCKWPTISRRPASTKAKLRSSGLCDGSWTSHAPEVKHDTSRRGVRADGGEAFTDTRGRPSRNEIAVGLDSYG